jgi:hypothetical protein
LPIPTFLVELRPWNFSRSTWAVSSPSRIGLERMFHPCSQKRPSSELKRRVGYRSTLAVISPSRIVLDRMFHPCSQRRPSSELNAALLTPIRGLGNLISYKTEPFQNLNTEFRSCAAHSDPLKDVYRWKKKKMTIGAQDEFISELWSLLYGSQNSDEELWHCFFGGPTLDIPSLACFEPRWGRV